MSCHVTENGRNNEKIFPFPCCFEHYTVCTAFYVAAKYDKCPRDSKLSSSINPLIKYCIFITMFMAHLCILNVFCIRVKMSTV